MSKHKMNLDLIHNGEGKQINCFIQMGAGAGDQDYRANNRDGFSELVKSLNPNNIERIILIEPNQANHTALKHCWKDYKQAEILQIGITPNKAHDSITFYYAEEDAPYFQVCSTVITHVQKHYPKGNIKSFTSECKEVNEFLTTTLENHLDCFLGIDVEGLDFEILMSLHLADFPNIKWISFEYIHLTLKQIIQIYIKFIKNGFTYRGKGIDHNGFDLLFGTNKIPKTKIFYLNCRFLLWVVKLLFR